MKNSQQDLINFVNDPENIRKAVEGSMDKRNAVMNPANQTPQSTFDEKLDEILEKHSYFIYSGAPDFYVPGGGTVEMLDSEEAKQAIIDLVLNDVIGETVQLNDIYGNDWRNNYGYNETQVRDAANWLKRKQRAIIKGGNYED